MLTLLDSPEEAALRREVQAWAAAELPDDLRWREDFASLLEVERRLSRAGLIGVTWPTRYGGRGLDPLAEAVLTEELGRVGVRRTRTPSQQGVNNFAPALMAHGSEAQKQRFLPRILAVEEIWCQGFSEPDAGSDLANIHTTARPDGEGGWVVSGAKLWTSHAHHADWMYALVRTGPASDRHRSLSVVVLPVSSAGVTVRPIVQTTGTSEFCEVFLDDVAVPAGAVVGEVGGGWAVALTVLSSERLSGRLRYAMFRRELDQLATEVAAAGPDGRDRLWLAELGRAVAEVEGIQALSFEVDSRRHAGEDTSALSSVNKLWWPAAHQRMLDVALRAATAHGTDPDRWYAKWLESRAESIYGGTAQIQRNIIAERHLGMPRKG